jgi:hypothetical protein
MASATIIANGKSLRMDGVMAIPPDTCIQLPEMCNVNAIKRWLDSP